MRTFVGSRSDVGPAVVLLDGKPLPPRHDLRNHSPDGFNWGYGGSGPAQLALAMVAAVAGDAIAQVVYQDFKREVVATLEDHTWAMSVSAVWEWLRSYNSKIEEALHASDQNDC